MITELIMEEILKEENKAEEPTKRKYTRKKVSTRGGAREGAGRKPFAAEDKKMHISIYMLPSYIDKYKRLRDSGVDMTALFMETIDKWAKIKGIH